MTTLLLVALLATPGDELVDVSRLVPDAVLDIRYATADNFLGHKLYSLPRCLLRGPVAERLARAAERLRTRGYRLRLWDCYRPQAVQWEMWRSRPQRGYVANPRFGSNHNRGAAVDLSLVTADGRDVEMPTPFDSFEPRARAIATAGITRAARHNRWILRQAMEAEGFVVNRMEWWHYDAPAARTYRLLDVPLESAALRTAGNKPRPYKPCDSSNLGAPNPDANPRSVPGLSVAPDPCLIRAAGHGTRQRSSGSGSHSEAGPWTSDESSAHKPRAP